MIGATDPAKAKPGIIQGNFGGSITANIIHAADSPKMLKRNQDHLKPKEILQC